MVAGFYLFALIWTTRATEKVGVRSGVRQRWTLSKPIQGKGSAEAALVMGGWATL